MNINYNIPVHTSTKSNQNPYDWRRIAKSRCLFNFLSSFFFSYPSPRLKIHSLHDKQLEILHGLEASHDVLGILPTGFGKSLCFQLVCVVAGSEQSHVIIVFPTMALMEDEFNRFGCFGISCRMIETEEMIKEFLAAPAKARVSCGSCGDGVDGDRKICTHC